MKTKLQLTSVALLSILLLISGCRRDFDSSKAYSLIPLPYSLQQNAKSFELNNETRIVYSGENIESSAHLLKQFISVVSTLNLEVLSQEEAKDLKNVILLSTVAREEKLGKEGYRMYVDKDKVIVNSNDADGIFYGVQTLRQLFENQMLASEKESLSVPAIRIWDEPRFSYRGMHLDVCRHFFDVEFIKHYLDLMAYYKYNTFHWHLTEDQGWRIEIKKYPKLTEVGAWRTEEDGSRYGGFYTQEEIKEVIAYAKNLHINIIPEIEMPGHSRAALAAYPELSCTGKAQEVPNSWGVFDDIYCAGNEQTFEFIQDVLDEVIALFPGDYIHIGGDEARKARWEVCEKCQARIQNEGLKDEHELQSYFIKRIDAYLTSKGKKLIGWDEILEGGLAQNATVMSWRGTEGGIAAARLGNDVVNTPSSHCYFDHYQADRNYEPKAIGGFTSLKKVYDFEPVPEDLYTEQKALILGAQANVWSEYIETEEYVEYMILPRMLALSEVLWGRKRNQNWDAFQFRLQKHLQWFDKENYRYSKGSYRLEFAVNLDTTSNQKMVEIQSEQYLPTIFYTTNGREPDTTSTRYQGIFPIDSTVKMIRAGVFEKGHLMQASSKIDLLD
ncbi:MAG: family 20 glycosylhydrolase [Bacteroidales bacterium]|nr:family 20 glycosylhydrolase [Bacteroidales bacterium]